MTVTDIPARLVALPDEAGVARFGVSLLGVNEGCVPAPAVRSGDPHSALQEIHGGLVTHATARAHVIVVAVARTRPGVDDDDLERFQTMTDAGEFPFDLGRARDVPVGQVPEIELDAGLKAPFERNFIDRDGALALVHGGGKMVR